MEKDNKEVKETIEKEEKVRWHKKIVREFRKIRWTNWTTTKKSFFTTLIIIIIASLFFFGITLGIIELLELMGAI